jgi:hypothetical protein
LYKVLNKKNFIPAVQPEIVLNEGLCGAIMIVTIDMHYCRVGKYKYKGNMNLVGS